MTVFLTILKIFGFVLLGILGLILLVILVLILLPAKYRLECRTEGESKFDYEPSWVVKLIYLFSNKDSHLLERLLKEDKILEDSRFWSAVKIALPKIVKVIRIVLPKDAAGDGEFGFSSPEITGYATGALAVIWPYHENFRLVPDFNHEVLRLDCKLKGCYILAPIVYYALCVLFHKDVFYVVKLVIAAARRKESYGQE